VKLIAGLLLAGSVLAIDGGRARAGGQFQAIPCLPQVYVANHNSCPPENSNEPVREKTSPFLDVDKLHRQGQFYQAPTPANGLTDSTAATLGNCVVHGTFEKLTGLLPRDPNRICLAGYQQVLPKTSYDVLGISSATPLDSLTTLRCYTSDDDIKRMRFGGPASIGSIEIKCSGAINGVPVLYQPILSISSTQKKLIVSAARIAVCGPSMLIENGETYQALLKKYGQPTSVSPMIGVPDQIADIRFTVGSTVITVRARPAERSPMINMGCASVLQFYVDETQYNAAFVDLLNATVSGREAGVKTKF
jgi:hypothetical protein